MQAVLIAGGMGTRLRPLTLTRPKALLPLLNRPMILHLFERMPSFVDEVIVAGSHGVDKLRDFFAREDVGRPVEIVREKRPLGTGGCLKNLEDRIGGTFLALNADVVSSVALADLVAAHRRFGGVGAIALWEVEDPSAFGVVAMKGDRITKFVEKPGKGEAPSNLANAGAYALEPDVLAAMSEGDTISLERDVFPKLVRKGLYGFPFTGYWADAGTLEHFLHATEVLLLARGSEVSRRASILPAARLTKPLAVAADAQVGGDVGPVVTIGESCVVEDARIVRSVLLPNVTVARGARVEGSILGEGCRIGPRAVVRGSIVADRALVAENARVVDARVRA
ncbi:MAG TPA: NDP-sugar synthase [Thermoplasmata archaeon]|nr:NDP-sugar synthase [Thermoplasmata archaeon]